MAEEVKKKRGRKPKNETISEPVAEVEETVSLQEDSVEATVEPDGNPAKEEPKQEDVRNDDEITYLKNLVMELQAQLASQRPQVVQVMADTERVTMRFQAEVSDDNVAVFGPDGMYGQVTGKTGIVTVPKAEWSRFYNESVRNMIARRWLIVLSGMDEQEREMYGCAYKDGEILDEMAFHKLLDMGRELIAVFPALCEEHQSMIARRFIDAWVKGDHRANDRDLVVALNEMSKETYRNAENGDPRRKGLFWPIIEGMNAKDAE